MSNVTPTEVRQFMGLSSTDNPDDESLELLIDVSETEIGGDFASGDKRLMRLVTFLKVGENVCRNRADQLLAPGVVTYSIDNVQLQRAYQQYMDKARWYTEKYNLVINKYQTDAVWTAAITNQSSLSDAAVDFIEMVNGLSDAGNYEDDVYARPPSRTNVTGT